MLRNKFERWQELYSKNYSQSVPFHSKSRQWTNDLYKPNKPEHIKISSGRGAEIADSKADLTLFCHKI